MCIRKAEYKRNHKGVGYRWTLVFCVDAKRTTNVVAVFATEIFARLLPLLSGENNSDDG